MNDQFSLLCGIDLPPYQLLNSNSQVPLLIVVDHGGQAIPAKLNSLGLNQEQLNSHIAWDIGAAKVAEHLSRRFQACTVLANYSRLVIDCNRYTSDNASIVDHSDGVNITANQTLTTVATERRIGEIYRPYHDAIDQQIQRFLNRGIVPLVLSVHSMTPSLKLQHRKENIAICWSDDARAAQRSLLTLNQWDDIVVGDNTPYAQIIGEDYTIPEHALAKGLPSLMVEFRQDLVASDPGAEHWADRFAEVIDDLLKQRLGLLHCPGPVLQTEKQGSLI